MGGWRGYKLMGTRLIAGGRRRCDIGSCNAWCGGGWLGGGVLEIGEVARLLRARLNGGESQMHLMLHGAGDAMQLPDELFEFFGTAETQVAVPQEANGQHE